MMQFGWGTRYDGQDVLRRTDIFSVLGEAGPGQEFSLEALFDRLEDMEVGR